MEEAKEAEERRSFKEADEPNDVKEVKEVQDERRRARPVRMRVLLLFRYAFYPSNKRAGGTAIRRGSRGSGGDKGSKGSDGEGLPRRETKRDSSSLRSVGMTTKVENGGEAWGASSPVSSSNSSASFDPFAASRQLK